MRIFPRFTRFARKLIANPIQLKVVLKQVSDQLQNGGEKVAQLRDDASLLLRLVKSLTFGQYKEIPKEALLRAVVALVYFVAIVDTIPDFILGVGFLDDAAVIAWTLKALKKELERFREWEKQQGRR